MEDLTTGGNPLLHLEGKIVTHVALFTKLFLVMAVAIFILIVVVIWLVATRPDCSATPSQQGFNSSFNQVDFSGITGNTNTNETSFDSFNSRLNPAMLGRQNFDVDPRNSVQKRFDNAFEQGKH